MSSSVLPVDVLIPEVAGVLSGLPNLVLEAAPGAGKTTRVPPALLQIVRGDVLVLEPRRIAARMAARRVAEELGERPGDTVGYQVRFEEVAGPRTRLRFVTEGVLTRRLLSDPELRGVDAVVLDEFHERHLDSDLALALLRRLQERRPELRLVVMSATLDAAPVAEFLGGCPALRSEGRLFPLRITHLPYSPLPLENQVAAAVEALAREDNPGHTLIFLPGAAEIRRAMRACEGVARASGLLMLPLHGDLSPEEQDRAVAPSQRKLIFATNVAESSITVEGATAVIDSGLARIATHSPWTGLPTLHVGRISKASATQRAGRAGRTGPGRVLRLYPQEDFAQRPEHDTPEILRSDLSQLCLALRAMGVRGVEELGWLDAPPPEAVKSAEALLDRLGVNTEAAQELVRYPLPPRLARMLVSAVSRGVAEQGCAAAALLSSGVRTSHTDLATAMEHERDPRFLQVKRQLQSIARRGQQAVPSRHAAHIAAHEDALLLAVLSGFPDRVARRQPRAGSDGRRVLLSGGGSAEFATQPPGYEYMAAVDVEDRRDKPLPLVRLASRIEPEWLLDLFPDRVQEDSGVRWDRAEERVQGYSVLRYDELVLEENRDLPPAAEAASALLAEKASEAGIARFVDAEELNTLLERIAFAGLPAPDLSAHTRVACEGLRSFAQLRESARHLLAAIEQQYAADGLQSLAPATVRLKINRQLKVHYEAGKPPWVESRLQDFFGMKETPRLGRDRMPVVVHLLAPNKRAVQTTTDLAGFWERLYPEVRRSLMRRYPKHQWPEKPV